MTGRLKTLAARLVGGCCARRDDRPGAASALHLERIRERADRSLSLATGGTIPSSLNWSPCSRRSRSRPSSILTAICPMASPCSSACSPCRGRRVCRIGLTISVDDIAVGEATDRDRRGRPLPKWQGCRVVGDGELFLMNWQSRRLS